MAEDKESKKKYYDGLLERAKWEFISDREIGVVAQELETTTDRFPYTLLHILGRGVEQSIARGGKLPQSYINIVERYLHGQDDDLAKLAWWILTIWWDIPERYVPEMFEFIRGPVWEPQEARWAALRGAGHYLSTHSNAELLEAIIKVFENVAEDTYVRAYAYVTLAKLMGYAVDYTPGFYPGSIDPDYVPDSTVLPNAKARLAREQSI
jgi:hypothetical protein